MNAALDASELLGHLAGDVASIEAIAQAWPPEQQATVERLKQAIEALHREALVRLIKTLRTDPAAAAQLKQAVQDPIVFGVLRLHGIVRDPLEVRVRAALESVAPLLAEHQGGVELVAIVPPDTVEVRLTGSCRTCPASGQTLSAGVERAIKEHAPEIVTVRQVQRAPTSAGADQAVPIHFISPFAADESKGFIDVGALADMPLGQTIARTVLDQSVLLYRAGDQVFCVDNTCAHLGMPLAGAPVRDGILECPHHGFRYRLDTGECLDIPQVQLVVHAVRVQAGRISVRIGG